MLCCYMNILFKCCVVIQIFCSNVLLVVVIGTICLNASCYLNNLFVCCAVIQTICSNAMLLFEHIVQMPCCYSNILFKCGAVIRKCCSNAVLLNEHFVLILVLKVGSEYYKFSIDQKHHSSRLTTATWANSKFY